MKTSNGVKVSVYNLEAKKAATIELPENIFAVAWNPDLMHQVIESMRASKRHVIAHVKGRGEVRGGGRKPWRQKGTGRARHGSIRSPLWTGGGVTHGPTKDKIYAKKINKKVRKKAFFIALSKKLSDGEILVLDTIRFPDGKTKKASRTLHALSKIKGFEKLSKKGTKIIISPVDKKSALALRNIPGVKIMEARNVNALDLLSARFIMMTKDDIIRLGKAS